MKQIQTSLFKKALHGKRLLSYILTAALAFLLGVFALACVLRPQPLDIGSLELSTAADGQYIGVCQNKILLAVVRVTVKDHRITDIEVLEHKASYMAQAVRTADAVCESQSLEVDAVSGATLTRDTVLKAVENALSSTEGGTK